MIGTITKQKRASFIAVASSFFLLLALVLSGLAPLVAKAHAPTLYSVSPNDDQLRTVDPLTGLTITTTTITLAGESVLGGTGLAQDPTTGTLWALLKVSGQTGRELVTIDPITGVATSIGNTGSAGGFSTTGFAGITFIADGTLYAVTGDGGNPPETLFTLSKTNAAPTFVLTLGNGNDGETIAFNPEDCLIYHASGIGDQNLEEIFETINPSNLVITNVPITGFDYHEAVALVDNGSSFLFAAGPATVSKTQTLQSVTDAGVVSVIGSMDHTAKGLAFLRHHDNGDVPRCQLSVGGVTSFSNGSGTSTGTFTFALLAGGVAAVVAITAGGWYTRRRWLGSRS